MKEKLYNHLKDFQDRREKLRIAHARALEELEPHKGSAYYEQKLGEVSKEYQQGLDSLRASATADLQRVFDDMQSALSGRGIAAPTEESLRLLSVAKMKERLTLDELDALANSVDGNGLCLSVIADLARANGFSGMRYLARGELSTDRAQGMLKELRGGVRDFIESNVSRPAKAMLKRQRLLGLPAVDADTLPRRELFNNANECLYEIARWSVDASDAFFRACDGAEGK